MRILLMICSFFFFAFVSNLSAQKKPEPFRVCGDPSAACANRAAFRDDDIPFEYNMNSVAAESSPFYAVIVKSLKLAEDGVCENTPTDFERQLIQWNFLKNKVFIARGCYAIEHNFYNGLGTDTIALAIYAGSTKVAADQFLKKVKAKIEAKDAYILKITTGFNGT